MKISELKGAPEWLVLASTENADVDYNRRGEVVWKRGNFLGGNFLGGNFLGGNFLDGNFLGGNFLDGNFLDGNFLGGNFQDGNFRGGNFRGGDFLGGNFLGGNFLGGNFLGGDFLGGNFLGGNFLDGNFRGGNFQGGNFQGGNFQGGLMIPNCRWVYGQDTSGNIIIGCKRRTVIEWEEWFAGEEVFDTPRNSKEFNKIQACFEAIKAHMNFINLQQDGTQKKKG